ncbi:hypothetical protein [Olsenella intestinalis]|uniref:hypothetical protein n=1 Tax=Olsenella intestinalis TaxID=2930083 RepID=UPI00200CEB35|nr:hypothetical protein [Olsenella intestinalis]
MPKRPALVGGSPRIRQAGRAGAASIDTLGALAFGLEELGLGFLELVHVVAVIGEERVCRLDVAHDREPQFEIDPIGLFLGLEFGDFVAQPLGVLGVLGRFGRQG